MCDLKPATHSCKITGHKNKVILGLPPVSGIWQCNKFDVWIVYTRARPAGMEQHQQRRQGVRQLEGNLPVPNRNAYRPPDRCGLLDHIRPHRRIDMLRLGTGSLPRPTPCLRC